jgi:hypothetical protein
MGPDQRKKVEMLHNCTYGYAIGVFIDGKPMKKKDVDYTLIQRQFMTAHKPAVPQSFLSPMTANVVSTCRNTATALSADFIGQEHSPPTAQLQKGCTKMDVRFFADVRGCTNFWWFEGGGGRDFFGFCVTRRRG